MIPDLQNPNPSLQSTILDILSIRPKQTVKELYGMFLQKNKRKISIQAFYTVIKKMVVQRILVKEEHALTIDASWIDALLRFSEILKKNYLLNEASVSNIVLRPGEARKFTFETVMAMDNFWTHALIITLYNYRQNPDIDDGNVYGYNHHSWFQIARTGQEQGLVKAYGQIGMKYYVLSGSRSFLDNAVADIVESKNFNYKTIEPSEIFKINYYLTVVGDIIFETQLPKYIYELMEEIYKKVTNISEFERQEIIKLIQLPAKTVLTISHDKKKAKQLREAIKKYF